MKKINQINSKYIRDKCKIGFAHIGVGNFHRAHQAYYINKYMNQSKDLNWGIVGINLRKNEGENLNYLKERGGKYILKTISTNGKKKYQEIQSIIKLLDWSTNTKEAENIFHNPDIEIVTITVTESGYYISENNNLNLNLSIVKNNIKEKEKSIIYSYLYNALKIRKNTCNKPITLLCCDNIRENGAMLDKALKSYIKACGNNDLLEWTIKNVSFPSCVVDRITPRPPESLVSEIKNNFNVNEKCSVMAEPFLQWVIEDNFIGQRPKLEEVGVKFVKNVFPYEEAKIRMLNGGHVALSYFGALKGYSTYDQAINDVDLQNYFFELEKKEIIPALGDKIPFDLDDYMMVIFDRFKNANIGDKLERIAMDGVGKFPIFILPTINNCFEKKIIPENAIESIASWYVFMCKVDSNKLNFNYYEPSWDWIKKYLTLDKISDFINSKELWGDTPNKYSKFSKILESKINFLKKIYL